MIGESERTEFISALHSNLSIISEVAGKSVMSAAEYIRFGYLPAAGVVCDNDCGMMIRFINQDRQGFDKSNMVYISLINKIVCVDCYFKMLTEALDEPH